MKIAIVDDYQDVALAMADWSALERRAEITVFADHLADQDDLVNRLESFDVVCVMRERTPLPREVIERLPRLKLIASTGPGNASIDYDAAADCDVVVTDTGYDPTSTVELTWALIMASARHLVDECGSVRAGGWQTTVGRQLRGQTLGVLGLGNIGTEIARIGATFGMNVVAWSQNLDAATAEEAGATLVSKDELFRQSDTLTVHLKLGDRSRGLVGADELALMKPTSWVVNTSRGPIVDEAALIEALTTRSIGGAALDVFDTEPLPTDHPLRSLPNALVTPHIGYVEEELYRTFYGDAVARITEWLDNTTED
ncbi:D-2-hydroxyacid dehydrogenase family protein [Mycolicibacterium hodleri]|uniref:D-2-hydroxyacid dehydrogenase family protein n=1 Tax=Mycolicibacterium hodleri TaxID=49897 RepID=UPI0021F2CEBC|nr:D-2-hydroxyacid dehydrogenase family protein [Mycolicibacterium hodleri]